ncbi:MAG: AMP-binding protein [Acidilobus sp.]
MSSVEEIYSYKRIKSAAERAAKDPAAFWAQQANLISWFKPPTTALEGEPPHEKWFVGGITNVAYNAVDRHLDDKANKVAFYWTNERLEVKHVSYRDLFYEVNRAAYVLRELGVKHGDVVSMIMPNIPEAVYFGLAVHRLGAVLAIHYVGLSDEVLATRLVDAGSKVLVVASKGFRAGQEIRIKDLADRVLERYQTPVEKVLVVSRGFSDFNLKGGRDLVYEDIAPKGKVYVPPEPVEANEVGTIYYTSGTTGKPKGITQTQGGYVVALNWTFKALFNLGPNDVWWTLSELGWPVWPMANLYTAPVSGVTAVLFEGYVGARPDLFAKIVERFGVTHVWSSTTTLYTLKGLGTESVKGGDTSSLKIILNTGEPLNVGAWQWFRENLPDVTIADAYWMTEHLSPIAGTPYGLGEIPFKPGAAGIPFSPTQVFILDDDGNPLPPGRKGYIALKPMSPALGKMWNDPGLERYKKTYWSRFPGYFYTGDYGYMDEDGYLYVLGRADDVLAAGGQRVGTMEVESVIGTHPAVAEVAAAGMPLPGGKGEALLAFVVLRPGYQPSDQLENDIKAYARNAGFIVDRVVFVRKLPKTKSGKIMRRLLRATLRAEPLGDISTLDDPAAFEETRKIIEQVREEFKRAMGGA